MEKEWLVRRRQQQKGPFTEKEIIQLITMGALKGSDEIWMPKLHYWFRIEDTVLCAYLPEENN